MPCFTRKDWADYVDGCLSEDWLRLMEGHMVNCEECRLTAEEFRDVERHLRAAARRLRSGLPDARQDLSGTRSTRRFPPRSSW